MSYKELIATAENLIRAGQIPKAADELKKVRLSHIPDQEAYALANLFRRTGQAEAGFRILNPLIRSNQELKREPNIEELSEYSVLLIRMGAVQEAIDLLTPLPKQSTPQLYFNLALAQITQWDYSGAIPNLLKHLEHIQDPYTKRVTEMNLAAAYYYTGKPDKAFEFASKVRGTEKVGRLRANALEILARLAIDKHHFKEANRLLNEATDILREAKTFDQLFIQGCRAYLEALERGSSQRIEEYRTEALRRQRYESVREADWFRLRVKPDQKLFDHLYFGTPYQGLREHLRSSLGLTPSSNSYTLGNGNKIFDCSTLEPTKPQGLISLVIRDFYRPLSVGAIFSQLFPGEYFEINSSRLRIRQLSHRARTWLNESGYDLDLRSVRGLYQCQPGPDIKLIVPEAFQPLSHTERILKDMQKIFPPATEFSLREAQARLEVEESSLRKTLRFGISHGHLEKFGAGSRTVYYLK